MTKNSHGCHDCAHGRRDDILGHKCDLSSWITSMDEHGNCEQWGPKAILANAHPACPKLPAGALPDPDACVGCDGCLPGGGPPDADGAKRRTDDNLRRAFG